MIKQKLILLVSVFLSLIFYGTATFSATYYIDYRGGDDANTGASSAAAWMRCPGDEQASGKAGRTNLVAGDTVIFKGGVIYAGSIGLDWSGASGKLITYDGNSAGTWGTGKAIVQGAGYDGGVGVDNEAGFYASALRSYIDIRNFEIRGFGGGAVNTSCTDLHQIDGRGIHFSKGASNVTVKDCKIWDIGDWENKEFAHQGYMEGQAILFSGSSNNITIDNIEISKVGRGGVYFASRGLNPVITNIEIKNCDIYDHVRWGIYFGAGTNNSTFQDINIHDNLIHDFTDGTPWLGCSRAYPHFDMMMFTPNSYGTGQVLGTPDHPIRIYNNTFSSSITKVSGTAEIFMTAWGGTMYIYNNVFKNPRASNGVIYGQGMNRNHAADYHIYNNSFYGDRAFVVIRDRGGVSFSGRTAINVINNIFYYDGTGATLSVQAQGIPLSYYTAINNNIFFTKRTDGKIASSNEDGKKVYRTVNTLNALDNADGNIAGDPLYMDISYGIGADSSLNDLTLQAGSPGLNEGTDLSEYFITDFKGITRPGGNWDIGAY